MLNSIVKNLIKNLNQINPSGLILGKVKGRLRVWSKENFSFHISVFKIHVNGFKVNIVGSPNKSVVSDSCFYYEIPEEELGKSGVGKYSLNDEHSNFDLQNLNIRNEEFKSALASSNGLRYKPTLTHLTDIKYSHGQIKVELELGLELTDERTELAEVELEKSLKYKLGIKVSGTGIQKDEIKLEKCFPECEFFKYLIENKGKGKEGLFSKARRKTNTRKQINKNSVVNFD